MRPSALTPAGRGLIADHPDNLRMEAKAIAGLREEDRIQADREEAVLRAERSAVVTDWLDFDRVDRDYDLMAREERMADYAKRGTTR